MNPLAIVDDRNPSERRMSDPTDPAAVTSFDADQPITFEVAGVAVRAYRMAAAWSAGAPASPMPAPRMMIHVGQAEPFPASIIEPADSRASITEKVRRLVSAQLGVPQ